MHHSPLQPPLTLTTNKDPTVGVAHVVMPSLPLFSFLTLSIYPVKVHEWAPSPAFALLLLPSPSSPACLQAVGEGEGEELNFLAQSSAPALPDAAQLGIWATTTFVVGDQVGWHGAPVEGARVDRWRNRGGNGKLPSTQLGRILISRSRQGASDMH